MSAATAAPTDTAPDDGGQSREVDLKNRIDDIIILAIQLLILIILQSFSNSCSIKHKFPYEYAAPMCLILLIFCVSRHKFINKYRYVIFFC